MRRVNDIMIQVDDRLQPSAAKKPRVKTQAGVDEKPLRKPANPRTLAFRRLPPNWWKFACRAGTALAFLAVLAVPAWLVRSNAGTQLLERWHGHVINASARAGFRVEEIFVEGRNRTPRDELLAAMRIKRGDPILGVDLDAVRQRVEEIAWVKTAVVERRLPGVVHLLITERAPIAIWQNQGRYYLVDNVGQVVGDEIDEYAGLPLMVGEGAPDHAGDLRDLLKAEPELDKRVKAAQWVGDRRWDITFDRTQGGINVRLPEDDPLTAWHELAKLDRELSVLERNITLIDMRLPDRLVLRTPGGTGSPTIPSAAKHKPHSGKDA